MEKNDGVADFIEACSDDSVAYFCLMYGHEIVKDPAFLIEYFEEPMIGLVYYDYIDKDRYRQFNSFSQSSLDFDRNLVVSKAVLDKVRSNPPKTFHNLIKSAVEMGFMAIHSPYILTKLNE